MPRLILRLLAILLVCSGPALAASKKTVKLVQGTTVEQQIVSAIAAQALKKARFRFVMVDLSDTAAVQALDDGTVHAHLTMPAATHGVPSRTVSLGGLKGNGPDEPVLKLVSPNMKRRLPNAQKLLKRMVLPPETVSALARQVGAGSSVPDVTKAWMQQNSRIWKPWVAASKNWMKP